MYQHLKDSYWDVSMCGSGVVCIDFFQGWSIATTEGCFTAITRGWICSWITTVPSRFLISVRPHSSIPTINSRWWVGRWHCGTSHHNYCWVPQIMELVSICGVWMYTCWGASWKVVSQIRPPWTRTIPTPLRRLIRCAASSRRSSISRASWSHFTETSHPIICIKI
jgi:hypothetical protein